MKFKKSILLIIPVLIIFIGTLFSVWYLFNDKNISSKGIIESGEENENCGTRRGNCGEKNGNTGRASINLHVPETCTAGNIGAKVTIVEFSDFLCPYCKTASELLKTVMNGFDGKVKLVFVNYPLDKKCNSYVKAKMHQGACSLAKGAICASRQNRFGEYMEAAFALDVKNAGMPEMRRLAILSHLELPVFMDCLELPETGVELNNQMEALHKLNINSVPVIFINGKQLSNWSDKDAMVRMIENELAKKGE